MKKFILFLVCALVAFVGYSVLDSFSASAMSFAAIPMLANLSRQELEALVENHVSDSYEGDDYEGFDDLSDDDLYDGFDDDELSFIGAAKSFLDEKKNGVYLTFKIINNCGYSKIVCINPAFYSTLSINPDAFNAKTPSGPSGTMANNDLYRYTNVAQMIASGHQVDCVIADGDILFTDGWGLNDKTHKIYCQATNGKIADHLNFIKKNATRVPEIVLSSVRTSTGAVDTTQYNKIMKIQPVSPYRKFAETNVDLNDFFKVEQFQSGKIVIPTANYGLQLDDQNLVLLEVDNDITLTVTMKIGAIGNAANKLFKRAEKAQRNITVGTAGKIAPHVRKARKTAITKQLNMIRSVALGKKK
jgi:hypothetical protein